MIRQVRFLMAAVLATTLYGCDTGGFSDLQAFMDEVRAKPRKPIEPMPKEVIYEPFTYRAAGLRSPFQPPLRMEQAENERGRSDIQPDETRVKQFLEGFPLEGFTMVGTLANTGGNFALVKTGEGVHRVKVGDYIGRNHGRITSITPGAVELTEIVTDGEGGWLERPKTLTLQERS